MSNLLDYPYFVDDKGEYITNVPYGDYIKDYTPKVGEKVYDIKDFGAKESRSNNAEAINAAIECASKNGGGVVKVDGIFHTSFIVMQSNTALWVTKGSSLVSLTLDEFNAEGIAFGRGFIRANNVENIRLLGGGTIAGSGITFCAKARKNGLLKPMKRFVLKKYVLDFLWRLAQPKPTLGVLRPKLVRFENCKNIEIMGLEFRDSAEWTVSLEDSENITIDSVIINDNVKVANSDGFDIVGCSHVRINHVFISVGDDGIVLKAFKQNPIRDVDVTDAKIFSLANGFKIGSETKNDISDVKISNCDFFKCNTAGGYAGISIESCDGARISNIEISDIRMKGVVSCMLIWLGNRLRYDKKSIGSISNIKISDVYAEDVDLPMGIVGVKDKSGIVHNVKDITLKNVTVKYRDAKAMVLIKKKPFEGVMNGYPEIINLSKIPFLPDELNIFWDLPVYGLFERYTENVVLDKVKTVPRKGETVRCEFNKKHLS